MERNKREIAEIDYEIDEEYTDTIQNIFIQKSLKTKLVHRESV